MRPSTESIGEEQAKLLTDDSYRRERYDPRPGDVMYLHLSDLKLALEGIKSMAAIDVLDFGCGGSPYRALFPNARYVRADLQGTEDVDCVIDHNHRVNLPDESFDLILSTQVVEHVSDPDIYFDECHRLLRTGGQLVLSSHGIFEDHGCPFDFHRWTADGIATDLRAEGFDVIHSVKITTGPRAILFLLDRLCPQLPRRTVAGLALWTLMKLMSVNRRRFHRQIDAFLKDHRVVPSEVRRDGIYIGFLVAAVKCT